MGSGTAGDLEDDEDALEDDEEPLVHGRRRRKVAFMPSFGACPCLGCRDVPRLDGDCVMKIRRTPSTTADTGFG